MFRLISLLLAGLLLGSCQSTSPHVNEPPEKPDYLLYQRADPWVLKTEKGYLFTASVPEYNRVELRFSETLQGLATAEPKDIWFAHESGPQSANIWAPEVHHIDGRWYIYYAAGTKANPFDIRMYALENASPDPMQGEWRELGRIEHQLDSFSLDMTSFAVNGKRYMIWAQQDKEKTYNSALVLAEMVTPSKMGPKEIIITKPELDWEKEGFFVNEGPSVVIRHNKIMVSYSASAVDARYKIGLVWAEIGSDLLDPNSWHTVPRPLFYTNAELLRFGPGHSCFTVTQDGRDVLMYHSRDYRDIQGDPLYDHNRHARIRQFYWDDDGFPDFRQDEPDDLNPKVQARHEGDHDVE